MEATAFVVLCGNASTAPDRIVGPFESEAAATIWAASQPDQPARYAAPMPLTPLS
ncbi:MAG TPA: hypothetical protein VGH94_04325 [Acidimicrobiales bacterium]|jgi:hypothetical protein